MQWLRPKERLLEELELENVEIAKPNAGTPRRSYRRERSRILAVDDDPQEATSLVQANDPHLVLLDLMLPGTDGIELMGTYWIWPTFGHLPVRLRPG